MVESRVMLSMKASMRRHPSFSYEVPEPQSHVHIVTIAPVIQIEDLQMARDRRRRVSAKRAEATRRARRDAF
jgi:hypothetical protein